MKKTVLALFSIGAISLSGCSFSITSTPNDTPSTSSTVQSSVPAVPALATIGLVPDKKYLTRGLTQDGIYNPGEVDWTVWGSTPTAPPTYSFGFHEIPETQGSMNVGYNTRLTPSDVTIADSTDGENWVSYQFGGTISSNFTTATFEERRMIFEAYAAKNVKVTLYLTPQYKAGLQKALATL